MFYVHALPYGECSRWQVPSDGQRWSKTPTSDFKTNDLRLVNIGNPSALQEVEMAENAGQQP